MKTGITVDCALCGATNLPLAWTWRPYSHTPGVDWKSSPNARRRQVCLGETADESFLRLLKNAGLALAGDGMRLMTDTEIRDRQQAESTGRLF